MLRTKLAGTIFLLRRCIGGRASGALLCVSPGISLYHLSLLESRAAYHRGSKRTTAAATAIKQPGSTPSSSSASSSPLASSQKQRQQRRPRQQNKDVHCSTSTPAPPPQASEVLSEEELRELLRQHAHANEWQAALLQIKRYHLQSKQEQNPGQLKSSLLLSSFSSSSSSSLLWEEALMVELLCSGHGASAFAVWQQRHHSAHSGRESSTQTLDGTSSRSTAEPVALSATTTAALALYTLVVDGDAQAATDLLLLLPPKQSNPTSEKDDDEEEDKAIAYVRLLCRLARSNRTTPTAMSSGRDDECAIVEAERVLSWLLDRVKQEAKQTQLQSAPSSFPFSSKEKRPDAEEWTSPTGPLVFVFALLHSLPPSPPPPPPQQSRDTDKAVDALATRLLKWKPTDSTPTSTKAWSILLNLIQAAVRTVEEDRGKGGDVWVAAARVAMRDVDSSNAKEAPLGYMPNLLLATPIALFQPLQKSAASSDVFAALWAGLNEPVTAANGAGSSFSSDSAVTRSSSSSSSVCGWRRARLPTLASQLLFLSFRPDAPSPAVSTSLLEDLLTYHRPSSEKAETDEDKSCDKTGTASSSSSSPHLASGSKKRAYRSTPLRLHRLSLFARAPIPLTPTSLSVREQAVSLALAGREWVRFAFRSCEAPRQPTPATSHEQGQEEGAEETEKSQRPLVQSAVRPTRHALPALSLLSLLLLPHEVGTVGGGAVPFGRHPRVVEAVVQELLCIQAAQQQEHLSSKETARLELLCQEWSEFMSRALAAYVPFTLALSGGNDGAHNGSRGVTSQSIALSPLTLARLHRTWWLPDGLGLSESFCAAYKHALLRSSAVPNTSINSLAERIMAALKQAETDSGNDTARTRAVYVLCRWAWVTASLDGLASKNNRNSAKSDEVAVSSDARTVAQAIASTLERCRRSHRHDLATELVDVLVLPVIGNTIHNSNGHDDGATVLSELVRTVVCCCSYDDDAVGLTVAAEVAASVVRAVCHWRPALFPNYASLLRFSHTVTEKEKSSSAVSAAATAQLFFLLVEDVLCAETATTGRNGGGGRGGELGLILSGSQHQQKEECQGRACLAARLLQESIHTGENTDNTVSLLLWTPSVLVAVGRALRCSGAPVEVYSELIRRFLEQQKDGRVLIGPAARGVATKVQLVEETSLYALQLSKNKINKKADDSASATGAAVPVGMEEWRQSQDALRKAGRGMLAAFAVNYVLALWSWAHEAIRENANSGSDNSNPVNFRSRIAHVTRILLSSSSPPTTPRRATASTTPTLWATEDVAQLMSAAEREALRTLLLLYLMHYRTSHGLPTSEYDAVAYRLMRRLPQQQGQGRQRPQRPQPQAIARHLDRLCRTEAPALLSVYGPLAQQVVLQFTSLRDALARGVPQQLLPLLTTATSSNDDEEKNSEMTQGERKPPRPSSSASSKGWQSKKAKINALMDAGDWAAALAAIPAVFTSPMHVVRKSLCACETAPHKAAGPAWQGALAVWRYARQQQHKQQEQQRKNEVLPPSASAGAPPFRLGLHEVGRITMLLAQARRWAEALALFDELDTDQIDGFAFGQIAAALRATPGQGDKVVLLWARWRSRVGDAAVPAPAMVDGLLGAGVVSTQGIAATAACQMIKEAVLAPFVEGPAAPSSPSITTTATTTVEAEGVKKEEAKAQKATVKPPDFPLPGTAVPLSFENAARERVVATLLRERWREPWQSALALAVASGRPALVATVAQHSPLHAGIYEAGTLALRERQAHVEMTMMQRAALAQHVLGPRGPISFSSSAAEHDDDGSGQQSNHEEEEKGKKAAGEKSSSSSSGESTRLARVRKESANVERLLKDLLASVNFALTPLRRIRLLMSVQDDLVEEGVLPENRHGFGGAIGCAKFLYQMGGVRAFYRGALLDYGGVIVKYLIQVAVVVPICRRVPLQMQRSYMLTTLFHTLVLFFPVAPVQVLLDTIIVNACTDLVRKDEQNAKETRENEEKGVVVDGGKFRYRFASLWSALKATAHTLPILPLMNKLVLLDFAGRYISSLIFNKAMGYFYDQLLGNGANPTGVDNNQVILWMMRVAPPLLSLGYGLLTYPFVNLPLSHFTRVKFHEREAAAAAAATEEEEREYHRSAPAGSAASEAASPNKSFGGNSNKSFARSQRLSTGPRVDENGDALWLDKAMDVICHWDVRDYLYYTYEQSGIAGLYRGYSVRVVTVVASAVLGAAVSSALTALRHSPHDHSSSASLDH